MSRSRSYSYSRSRSRSRSRSYSHTPSHLNSAAAATTTTTKPTPTIDRSKTTPFLLHLTYRANAFHNLTEFPLASTSQSHPYSRPRLPPHLQIYTWPTCSLLELAHLLTTALPTLLPNPAIGTRLAFRLVYPDLSTTAGAGTGGTSGTGRLDEGRGRYTSRELGSVIISAPAVTRRSENGNANANVNELAEETAAVSSVSPTDREWELGGDDGAKTLADARFVIGDYVDCAVFPPLPDGSVMPRPRAHGNGGVGRGRGGMGRGASIPVGEWRRGERLPGGADNGYRGRAGGAGGYRRAPY